MHSVCLFFIFFYFFLFFFIFFYFFYYKIYNTVDTQLILNFHSRFQFRLIVDIHDFYNSDDTTVLLVP
jgi:hypothetical protein